MGAITTMPTHTFIIFIKKPQIPFKLNMIPASKLVEFQAYFY
jgi:hypothetical protein